MAVSAVWRVLRDAWPLMVAELLPSLASLVDIFFVSPLGSGAVAAVGVGGYASWLLSVFLSLFYIGVLVTASQALGGGDRVFAARVVGESLAAAALLAALVASAGWLLAPVLAGALAGDPSTAGEAAVYLRARLTGLPGFAVFLVWDAALRAAGRNRGILLASAVSAASNAALDPVLVPMLGVRGAGLATAASYYLALPPLARHLSRAGLQPRPSVPRGPAARAARLGLPAMLERLLFSGGHGLYLAAVARCGREALAAHSIGVRVESLAFLPAFALSTYAASVVGNAVGAGDLAGARRRGLEAAWSSALFMAFMGLLLAAASVPAARLLAPDERVAALAALYLVLAAVSEPALGLVMVVAGAIRGAGNTLVPTLVNLLGLYLFRVAPAALLVPGLRCRPLLCPLAAWLIMDFDVALRAIIFMVLYLKRFERLARRVA